MAHMPRYESWVFGECSMCRSLPCKVWACQLCHQPTCSHCVYLLMYFRRNRIRWSSRGRRHVYPVWMDWCVCWHCFQWASYIPEEWVHFQEHFDRYIDNWEGGVFHHYRRTTQRLYEELQQDLSLGLIYPEEVPEYFLSRHAVLERERVEFGYDNLTDTRNWDWNEQ